MKVTAFIISNLDEVNKYQQDKERLGDMPGSKPPPPIQEIELECYFALSAVSLCFLQPIDNRIKCIVAGQPIMIKNEGDVFHKIIQYLETR